MFWIIAIFSLMSIPLVAEEFVAERDGNMILAIPVGASLILSRNEEKVATDCSEVINKLKRNRQSIHRCLDEAEIPANFCQLLKGDLKRALTGDAEDIDQSWNLTVTTTTPSAEAFNKFLSEMQVPAEQVIPVTPTELQLGSTTAVADAESYTELLSRASVLDLKPNFEFSYHANEVKMNTANRILTCELLQGKIRVRTKVQRVYSYATVRDQAALHSLWELRERLAAIGKRVLREKQKYILAGFTLSSYLQSNNETVREDALFKLSSLLLNEDNGSPVYSLQAFRNIFHLGKFLPQQSKSVTKGLELEGRVE